MATVHQPIQNDPKTLKELGKGSAVTKTTIAALKKQKDQIVGLQTQIQSIALEVHRLHNVSKMDILSKIREVSAEKKQLNVDQYLYRMNMYRVASSYLMMHMDPNLFVYVTPQRRELLKDSKKSLLVAKHEIQKLDIPSDTQSKKRNESEIPSDAQSEKRKESKVLSDTSDHVKALDTWYIAIQEAEKCQNLNYAFASRRRMQMKGANILPIDLVNLLPHEDILDYNTRRNTIQRTEYELATDEIEEITNLNDLFNKWTTNLNLLFLIMKYTFGISKTINVQKCIQGAGLGDEKDAGGTLIKETLCKHEAKFIIHECDEGLIGLITDDASMGLYWIEDKTTTVENTTVLDEKEKLKLHRALEVRFPRKNTWTQIREIELPKDAWKDCGIRIVYPNTYIKVKDIIFKPKVDHRSAIFHIAARTNGEKTKQVNGKKADSQEEIPLVEAEFSENTKQFLQYCRGIKFRDYLVDKPPTLNAVLKNDDQ